MLWLLDLIHHRATNLKCTLSCKEWASLLKLVYSDAFRVMLILCSQESLLPGVFLLWKAWDWLLEIQDKAIFSNIAKIHLRKLSETGCTIWMTRKNGNNQWYLKVRNSKEAIRNNFHSIRAMLPACCQPQKLGSELGYYHVLRGETKSYTA